MDERLQRIERDGTPVAKLRARRQAGWSEEEAWRGLVTPELPYAEALELARELEGLRFLEVTRQRCGEVEGETGRLAHEATGLVFRLIPGGRFLMGSLKRAGTRRERPRHEVQLEPFLLCETPCTQRAWDRLRLEEANDIRSWLGGEWSHEDLPVVGVCWDQAQRWSTSAGMRLPSEAEWEYACRAGSASAFCFGDDEASLVDHSWYHQRDMGPLGGAGGLGWAQPVGLKRPNAWGLYDMHGNIWEWCLDAWVPTYHGALEDGSPRIDVGVSERVRRGGSWAHEASYCRSANRDGVSSELRNITTGFRVAKSLPTVCTQRTWTLQPM